MPSKPPRRKPRPPRLKLSHPLLQPTAHQRHEAAFGGTPGSMSPLGDGIRIVSSDKAKPFLAVLIIIVTCSWFLEFWDNEKVLRSSLRSANATFTSNFPTVCSKSINSPSFFAGSEKLWML